MANTLLQGYTWKELLRQTEYLDLHQVKEEEQTRDLNLHR